MNNPFKRKQDVSALVGSATLYKMGESRTAEVARLRQGWQDKAFEYEDLVGELNYGSSYFANAFGRIRLVAGEVSDDPASEEPIATENTTAKAIMDDFTAEGNSARLSRIGHHMFLVGETFLIGETMPDQSNKYTCYSVSEIIANGNWFDRLTGPGEVEHVPTDAQVIRLWRPHAQYSWLASSRVKAVQSRLEELILLSDGVMSGARARLSNGIVGFASELSFEDQTGPQPNPSDGDWLTQELLEHMTTPIKDKRSAAGFVPYIMRVPAKYLADDSWAKKLDFARPLDEKDMERRRECIERIAHGLELPAEILTGMGGVNHWGSWQISDDAFRAHIEPVLLVALSGLTTGWYRKMLEAAGVPEPERHVVWYDKSELVVEERRPFQEVGLPSLVTGGILTVNEARAAIGKEPIEGGDVLYAPTDPTGLPLLPSGTEREIIEEAPANDEPSTTTTPPAVAAAATPTQIQQQRSVKRLGRKLSELDRDLLQTLAIGSDAAIRRALERAGARLRSKARQQSPGAYEALKPVDNFLVAAQMGPQTVKSFGLDEDQLLADALTEFITKANTYIRRSQIEAIRLAAEAAGLDAEDVVDRLAEALDLKRAEAMRLLEGRLDDHAKKALYKPRPDVPLKGEFDELLVPRGALRQVISLAGGQDSGPEGLGNGAMVRSVLSEEGIVADSYIWDYGSSPRQSFPGHLALDGETFSGFDDPVLTVDPEDSWLGDAFYSPGDHDGCQCRIEQIFVQVERAA